MAQKQVVSGGVSANLLPTRLLVFGIEVVLVESELREVKGRVIGTVRRIERDGLVYTKCSFPNPTE